MYESYSARHSAEQKSLEMFEIPMKSSFSGPRHAGLWEAHMQLMLGSQLFHSTVKTMDVRSSKTPINGGSLYI